MRSHPDVQSSFRKELYDWRPWMTRAVVLAFAVLSGLTVVVFTWLSEQAQELFHVLAAWQWWAPLFWTPLCAAGIVWITRRFVPGAAGSGIPQVMAALTPGVDSSFRHFFVSLRLTLSKIVLTAWGLLGGLSLGREGPSVQIAAGVMHSARRWLPQHSGVSDHSLLVAGGAAGIAAAFNTPLGGIMFAIEELSRRPEQRNNGLIMAAIVLGGLMAVSVYGNGNYFGVIHVNAVSWSLLWPGLLVAICCGLSGGLFARLLIVSLSGLGSDRFSAWRRRYPVRFAAVCGLVVAVIGLVSVGATFGSGTTTTRAILEGEAQGSSPFYVLLKFIATWVTSWAGVPAGIFAPSLAIGGGLGHDIAMLVGHADRTTLIALGMAGFLAAVTQAPMTAFIIVMEMVDGHALVLTLMACTLIASGISRLISAPLYASLADLQLLRLPEAERPSRDADGSTSRYGHS